MLKSKGWAELALPFASPGRARPAPPPLQLSPVAEELALPLTTSVGELAPMTWV